MVAAMNGMAVHGGIIPYGGTFLVFADYCRPALRLAALMRQRVIFVATHDSIGLGEDGPTHQPVEHLASLRAIPNMLVFRPADAVETAGMLGAGAAPERRPVASWRSPARSSPPCATSTPTRTSAPAAPTCSRRGRRAARRHHPGHRAPRCTWRIAARALLAAEGITAAVVSMPCWELFERQDPAYRASGPGRPRPRVAVEAASPFGWTRYVGQRGRRGRHDRLRRQRTDQAAVRAFRHHGRARRAQGARACSAWTCRNQGRDAS